MNTYNTLIPSALKWAAVIWSVDHVSSGDVPMEYRQLKETHSGLYLTLDLIDVEVYIGSFSGQGSSFMVNDISGVFYAKINDVDYAIGNAGEKLMPVVQESVLLMNSTVEYGRLLPSIIHLIPLNSA
jgi:hypothetical protein